MNKEAKISCKNIWKLYGEAPEKFLKNTNNNPTTEEIKKNNYIPAVRDASIDCLLYTSPSPRDTNPSRMPSSA